MQFPCMNDPDSLFHLALEQPQVVTTGSKILTHDESIKWHSEVQHSEFIYRSFLISTWKGSKLDSERNACFFNRNYVGLEGILKAGKWFYLRCETYVEELYGSHWWRILFESSVQWWIFLVKINFSMFLFRSSPSSVSLYNI